MKHIKYTKEMLEEIVKKSYSIAHVIRNLEMVPSGGTHGHLTNKIKMYEIDTSHFKKYTSERKILSVNKRFWKEVLVKRDIGYTEKGKRLRISLIESGREYKCEECGLKDNWNNKPICIQIDHINGVRSDNTPENLRFLCPNCHSQTSTFGVSKNPFKKNKIKKCKRCGNDFHYNNIRRKYCSVVCSNNNESKKRKTKIVWPEKEILLKMLSESNYRQLGIKLGISDNAIRKHIKNAAVSKLVSEQR